MERGTLSSDWDKNGHEVLADLELVRSAVPRRVYSLSQIEYAVDRITWLHQHRDLIGGLKFVEEPPVLRFFFGKLVPLDDCGTKLVAAYQRDFGMTC
jgi:tryptophanase